VLSLFIARGKHEDRNIIAYILLALVCIGFLQAQESAAGFFSNTNNQLNELKEKNK
jgi:hypothetical protein